MLDLNVLLDVFQQRVPHYPSSAAVVSRVLYGDSAGILPAHALTTVHYVMEKSSGREQLNDLVDWMLERFDIAATDKTTFLRARRLSISDFEDAVVTSHAESNACDYIITRNVSDFNESSVPALTPEIFLQRHPSEA